MSDETKRALDAALAAHVADGCEEPLIVTGYVLQASWTSADCLTNGTTGYFREYADHQPLHASLGLADMLGRHVRAEIQTE